MNPKTNEELARKIETLNKKYFNGKLKIECRFKTRKSTRCLGTCSYDCRRKTSIIEINPLLKGYDITETLLHEMIHADNFQNLGHSSHGKEFKSVARKIYAMSNGKYDLCGHCTDKKLNEVVLAYAKEQKRIKNARKLHMTLKEYDKFVKNRMKKSA